MYSKKMNYTIEIRENDKTFVGYIDNYGRCDKWKRSNVTRKFTYKRCQMCGKLISFHSRHWYTHFNACIKRQKILSSTASQAS